MSYLYKNAETSMNESNCVHTFTHLNAVDVMLQIGKPESPVLPLHTQNHVQSNFEVRKVEIPD